ncbi:hypothetical protein BH23THE1_BH23THE1_32490 [soil metagenome]
MQRIPLRICTVSDAQWYYKHKLPIKYLSMQTYGGKDENGKVPSIKTYQELNSTFVLDGNLKWENTKTGEHAIIPNWLTYNTNGPYYTTDFQSIYCYLGGYRLEDEYYWMQICSRPLNGLSEDCFDEVNVWIPALYWCST